MSEKISRRKQHCKQNWSSEYSNPVYSWKRIVCCPPFFCHESSSKSETSDSAYLSHSTSGTEDTLPTSNSETIETQSTSSMRGSSSNRHTHRCFCMKCALSCNKEVSGGPVKPIKGDRCHSNEGEDQVFRRIGFSATYRVRDNEDVIQHRWKLCERIGKGGFGTVVEAQDLQTDKYVAVKIENTRRSNDSLATENIVYEKLRRLPEVERAGFARRFYYGNHLKSNVLVIEKLGQSLENLARNNHNNRKLSIKTVLMVGIQAVKRLQILHNVGYIHRDVKPDNMLSGSSDCSRIYLIDFGLAKKFWSDGHHIPYRNKKRGMVGTTRFASIYSHMGVELSRRDDLISLAYSLVYLKKGRLPWMEVNHDFVGDERFHIYERKRTTSPSQLCKNMPREIYKFVKYVMEMRFEDKPDYSYIRDLFLEALAKIGCQDDRKFDWC